MNFLLKHIRTIMFFLCLSLVIWLFWGGAIVMADERLQNNDCNGAGNCNVVVKDFSKSDTDNNYAEGGAGGTGIGMGGEGGTASAFSEGGNASGVGEVQVDASHNSESNNMNIVLVPNNNTADCHKVYGISFGKDGTAGGVGWPYRDKACDFEQAADDAAATGNHDAAWFWRCHKSSLQRQFGAKKVLFWQKHSPEAVEKCHAAMRNLLGIEPDEGGAKDVVTIDSDEYHALLMAQVQAEEFEEQQQLIEDRFEQYDNLIEQHAIEQKQDDAEIERLKREAEKLKAAERREAERRAKARERLLEKRAEGNKNGSENSNK